jgi:hypothetical protein
VLTQAQLKELLHYDPTTGIFIWLKALGPRAIVGHRAGRIKSGGYRLIGINGKGIEEHRLAWIYSYGALPQYEIDHINGITSDNRLINLQDIPHKGNSQRVNRPRKNNKCGCVGVHKHKNRFKAQITVDGAKIYLGSFTTIELASEAYQAAKLIHHHI